MSKQGSIRTVSPIFPLGLSKSGLNSDEYLLFSHLVCLNQGSIRTVSPVFPLGLSKSGLNSGRTFLFSSLLSPNQGLIGTLYRVFLLGLSKSRPNSDSFHYLYLNQKDLFNEGNFSVASDGSRVFIFT